MTADKTTKRKVVAAQPGVQLKDPFSREEFMSWADSYLARELGFLASDITPGQDDILKLFAKDLSIGVVANVRATTTFSGPCVRVHLSTTAKHRVAQWRSGWRPRGDVPVGVTVLVRLGDNGVVTYFEYLIPNYARNYGAVVSTTKRCIDLLLALKKTGVVE